VLIRKLVSNVTQDISSKVTIPVIHVKPSVLIVQIQTHVLPANMDFISKTPKLVHPAKPIVGAVPMKAVIASIAMVVTILEMVIVEDVETIVVIVQTQTLANTVILGTTPIVMEIAEDVLQTVTTATALVNVVIATLVTMSTMMVTVDPAQIIATIAKMAALAPIATIPIL
jgi:hypothetical protein